jgi:hypothetical protein
MRLFILLVFIATTCIQVAGLVCGSRLEDELNPLILIRLEINLLS